MQGEARSKSRKTGPERAEVRGRGKVLRLRTRVQRERISHMLVTGSTSRKEVNTRRFKDRKCK